MAPTITSRLAVKFYFRMSACLVYTDTDMMRIVSNDGGQRLNAKLEHVEVLIAIFRLDSRHQPVR